MGNINCIRNDISFKPGFILLFMEYYNKVSMCMSSNLLKLLNKSRKWADQYSDIGAREKMSIRGGFYVLKMCLSGSPDSSALNKGRILHQFVKFSNMLIRLTQVTSKKPQYIVAIESTYYYLSFNARLMSLKRKGVTIHA